MGGQPGYEFSQVENMTVAACGKGATILAIVLFVLAAGAVLSVCADPLSGMVTLVERIVGGVFLLTAAQALKLVTQTQGNDIAHMMGALGKLRNMFLVRLIATGIGLILTLISIAYAASELSKVYG